MELGVARRDVTPPAAIFSGLWGAADWRRTTGAHRSLTLTAVAFGSGSFGAGDGARVRANGEDVPSAGAGASLVLVTIDLGAWRRPVDERRLRDAVQRASGLGEAAVIIHLTHTHASPSLCPEDAGEPGGELIAPYLEALERAAVDAVVEALGSLRPVTIAWGWGSCRLAASRELSAGERDLVGWNPELEADDTVLVGRACEEATGAVVATLVNYACHPTTLGWGSALVSPDYMGAMRELVESGTGAPCAFLQGAEGDLAPREQYTGEPAVADRHGRGLGHAVLAVLAAMEPAAGVGGEALGALFESVSLPLKDAEAVEALAERFWPELAPSTRDARVRRAQWRRRQIGDAADGAAPYPTWVWRIGEALLVAHPGEAYSAFQQELRRRHPGVPIVVLSLANGSIWTYLPPVERYARNVYQVWHTAFEAGAHERLVEHADGLVTRSLARA